MTRKEEAADPYAPGADSADSDDFADEPGFGVDHVPRTDPMAGQLIRILVVDDTEPDYRLVAANLRRIERCFFDLDWAQTYDAGLLWTERDTHDVYLIDLNLGDRDGIELIREARRRGCRKPLIAISSANDRIADLRAMKAGASDFMPKDEMRPDSLERMIRYAIDRQRAEQRLVWLSRFDQLTGLANRSQFRERLVQAVARANQHDRVVALLTIDIDRFRDINERLGHESGDLVLCEVAHRITACLGNDGLLARVGSDEFVAIVEEVAAPEDAGRYALTILDRVRTARRDVGPGRRQHRRRRLPAGRRDHRNPLARL